MPEGPEIRRAADRIERAIAGREVTRVDLALPRLQRFAAELVGRRVVRVETRGKAMLIHFERELSIYTHSQLYGRWYVRRLGDLPKTGRSLRLAIHNGERSALLYSASEIDVLAPSELDAHPYLSKLGPDALDPKLTEAVLEKRIAERRFARRGLASLLLDQSFVAGIGNYLRSEILFVAGIDPWRRPCELFPDERRRLARAVRRVARQAYRTGGITNDEKRARSLAARGFRRRAYRHHVFAREGQRCWTCESVVRREVLAGRNLFHCPRCQPQVPRSGPARG